MNLDPENQTTCPACGQANSAPRKFCGECGAALAAVCGGCGASNEPGTKFCGDCGGPLTGRPAPSAGPTPGVSGDAAQTPTSFAGGRYQVHQFLGEGAKKRVYLATDSRLESEVAFALIKSEGLDPEGDARVRREIQAMGRLRDHPHIVPVFDVGEENGQSYIVSQYMSGGDIEHWLRQQQDHRLSVDEALRVADEIAQALEHAHTNGVVHRDLKPGNVWLTADHTAKLGDFGLAAATDRSRLTQEGTIVGTVAYMPPEQALGKSPDTRSDLYSLGAMLYEMLTGRPPFVGDDSVAIISQHINTPPVAPSWHNAEVTPPLEKLILALLAKDPNGRPDGAAAVRDSISVVLGASIEESAALPTNPLDGLAEGVFVGREAELAQLRRGVDGALSSPGRVLMLVGEPGIGKTRTAEEVVTYARMRGAQVLWGRCYEGEGAPAFWPWRQIIRSYVHECEPAELASEMGPGAADIAEVVSEVRERLPGLPQAPKLDAEQARFRLFDSIASFLRNAAKREPLVIVLDDLHWADKPSLMLLQFIARDLAGMRMLVLGTYRDVELSRQHPLAETLGELTRSQLCERVLLRGLQEADVGRYVELSTGREPPAALVEAIYRETEGNPFFTAEVVRLLEADGRLAAPENVTSWSVEIPQGVREVIGRRLNALSEECNRVLTLAAVLGREFDLLELEPLSELGGDELLELVEIAVGAHVVEEEAGVGCYRFSHALIRETLYDELSTTRRVRLHRRTGEVLEQIHAAKLEPHLPQLAHHFCEGAPGGDPDKAVHYAIRAAERAELAHAYEERALHFERAVQAQELKPDADPWAHCVLLIGLALSQNMAGEAASAWTNYRRAVEEARALGDPVQLGQVLVAGNIQAGGVGHVDEMMIAAYEETLDGVDPDDSALRAQLLSRLGMFLYFTDAMERVQQLTRDGLAMARRVGDDAALMTGLYLASLAVDPNDVITRRELSEERLKVAERIGNPEAALHAHQAAAAPALELGDLDAFHRHSEAMERLTKELRQHQYEWNIISHRSLVAIMEGRFEEAETLAQEILAARGGSGDPIIMQAYGAQMSALRRLQGRSAEMEPMLISLVEQFPTIGGFRGSLARGYAERGLEAEARTHFELVAADDFASVARDMTWLVTVVVASEVCNFLKDRERAATLYDWLLPFEDRFVVVPNTLCSGAVARYMGLLAETMDRWDDAERHFEHALELNKKIGARAHTASTLSNYGRMLLRRARSEDRERGLAMLNQSLEEARDMGMQALLEEALALKLEAQGVDSSDTQHSIYVVASAVQRDRPDLASTAAPDGTVTIMFSDMEGFTAMTERLGDVAAHRVVGRHNEIVREQLAAHDGRELELQGDGFLLAFADPLQGLRCAVEIQRAFEAHNRENGQEPLRVRIGLHCGEAIADADKFFGLTVILAARIAAQAKGSQVLVSSALAETAASSELRFDAEQVLELKGIREPQRVFELAWN